MAAQAVGKDKKQASVQKLQMPASFKMNKYCRWTDHILDDNRKKNQAKLDEQQKLLKETNVKAPKSNCKEADLFEQLLIISFKNNNNN